VFIATKYNGPINDAVNRGVVGDTSVDWLTLRTDWIKYIKVRAVISMAGFISLLVGLVFWKGQE
jgi:uncharacterized membrane protein